MWLFDDLLKKPTSTPVTDSSAGTSGSNPAGTGGGNPPITDPLADAVPVIKIQKSEEVAISTESVLDTASSEPPPVSAVAVDDVSSILVSNISSSTETANVFIAPVEITLQEVPETTMIVESADLLSHPSDTHDSLLPSSIVEQSVITPTEIPSSISDNTSSLDNLFGSSDPIAEDAPITSDNWIIASENQDIQISDSDQDKISELSFSGLDVWNSPAPQSDIYEHPADFIQSSIAKIDKMVERIDIAHTVKLEEALGYKTEKEKYTALEEEAYADAEKYVREKEHALTMRSYFEEQWKIDSVTQSATEEPKASIPVASVETTLTGLAVQSAVTETVQLEKKSKTLKKEEESVGLLGL